MKPLLLIAGLTSSALTLPAQAEALAEHTFLIAWAAEHCDGFDYAPDLLRHAVAEVQSAPEPEVRVYADGVIGGLEAMFEGDKTEICDTVIFLIESPEE